MHISPSPEPRTARAAESGRASIALSCPANPSDKLLVADRRERSKRRARSYDDAVLIYSSVEKSSRRNADVGASSECEPHMPLSDYAPDAARRIIYAAVAKPPAAARPIGDLYTHASPQELQAHLRALRGIPRPDGSHAHLTEYGGDLALGRYPTNIPATIPPAMKTALTLYDRHAYDVGRVAQELDVPRDYAVRLINSEILLRVACAEGGRPVPRMPKTKTRRRAQPSPENV